MVDLDQFFASVTAAESRVLFLDYDGTLAPFRVERDQAYPYPGVRELLAEIQAARTTRLVIVSGRPVAELLPLLGLASAPEMWGSHGWERQPAGGTVSPVALPPDLAAALQRGWAWLEENGLASRGERKPASLALHWRGLPPARIQQIQMMVRQGWQSLTAADSLQLREFDGGLELRVRGRDKGDAVRSVLAEEGPGSVAAYLGDDLTDEDAFTAIAGQGLGVLVRSEERSTNASCWLRPPAELRDFLARWAAAAGWME